VAEEDRKYQDLNHSIRKGCLEICKCEGHRTRGAVGQSSSLRLR
jgi:hypothetical protein